jgi:hypothetical protein
LLPLGEHLGDFPSHHGDDEFVLSELLRLPGADVLGIPKHRHPVREAVDVFEPVGDEDYRGPIVAQAFGDAIQFLGLVLGQRCRRLIHDDDLRVGGQRLGNLHDLLLRHRQVAHPGPGTELRVQLVEESLGLIVHLLPIDPLREGMGLLVTHEDVLRHGEVRIAGHMLVDRGNAVPLGVLGMPKLDRLTFQDDLTRVRNMNPGDDLDEGRLARPVFAHESVDFPPAQVEAHLVESFHPGEGLGDVIKLQDRV